MPVSFLTEAERERLSRFPAQVLPEDLITFFTLSDSDKGEVLKQRGDHNRLGFALQLCILRYLGFSPDDLDSVPYAVVDFVARQLEVPPEAITPYGRRIPTRTAHLQQVQAYLAFRKATPLDLGILAAWLLERALDPGSSPGQHCYSNWLARNCFAAGSCALGSAVSNAWWPQPARMPNKRHFVGWLLCWSRNVVPSWISS